jgi:hypothetical protein
VLRRWREPSSANEVEGASWYKDYTNTKGACQTVKNGDLSNVVVPRLVLVFEGALGFLEPDKVERYNALGTAGRWYDAARLWDFDELMMRKIMDLTFRQNFELEAVTYVGPAEFARELADRFDEDNIPIRRTTASTAEVMARRLSYAPDIAYVYDANRQTAFMYGQKGRYLRSAHELGR